MSNKILTVDDSRTVRTIIKKALKSYDCDIVEAGNGIEGLATAANEKPDLIILDVTMEIMTGFEMLEKLKEDPELEEIPVMMLTAVADKHLVMKLVKLGVKDYILKPFKPDELIKKVSKLIPLKPKALDQQPPAETEA